MSDVSALTLPLPSECLGVFLAWISARTDGATPRAQELSRTTPAFQTFNTSATVLDNNLLKYYFDYPVDVLPVGPAVESHVQPEPDCCTVCEVANLVTSNTTLATQALFCDGGLRTTTVTSVSGPSCSLLFNSCCSHQQWCCLHIQKLLRISFRCFLNPRRNTVARIENKVFRLITMLVVHLRARS